MFECILYKKYKKVYLYISNRYTCDVFRTHNTLSFQVQTLYWEDLHGGIKILLSSTCRCIVPFLIRIFRRKAQAGTATQTIHTLLKQNTRTYIYKQCTYIYIDSFLCTCRPIYQLIRHVIVLIFSLLFM